MKRRSMKSRSMKRGRAPSKRNILAAIRSFARQAVCFEQSGDIASAIIARGQLNKYRILAEKYGAGSHAFLAEMTGTTDGQKRKCTTQAPLTIFNHPRRM